MPLTAKQKGALMLVAQGLQDKEIATTLGVSNYAASKLVKVGKEKLGIPCYRYSRAQLAMLLRDHFGGKAYVGSKVNGN
jgi:DNA-binding NarL/FixJ family response regulator